MCRNAFRRILYLLSLSLIIACSKEESLNISPEPEPPVFNQVFPGVDEAMWPYFQRFEEEADRRGLQIDLVAAGISGVIEDIDSDNVLGQCNYSSLFPNHVIVDKTFWNQTSDRGREFVVFHELGHCELLRDHYEAAFANGVCQSIMRSGVEGCRDNYNAATRSAYLDELFDPDRAGDWLIQ